jgi:lauroyl/myristoyl acyltransferase/mitochondrial fission protein ELM1
MYSVKKHSMKNHRFRDLIIYKLIAFTGFIIRCIPRSASLYIGSFLGNLVYLFVKKRRQIALSNLKMALGKEKDDKELRQIALHSFQNMGKLLVEFLNIPKYDTEYLHKLIKIEGLEHFQKAMDTGKGVIGVSWHFGNWELIFQILSSLNYNSAAIVQPFKHHDLEVMVTSYRERHGGKIIKRKFATRETFKLLRKGFLVIFMSDQNAGEAGVFVDLFGMPASSPRGPVIFALRTGATILNMVDIRQEDDSHLLSISKPLELEITGELEEDVKVNTSKLMKMLEDVVRKYPEQWLWMHNRWKTRPPENNLTALPEILVLSDGKPGHYNQSFGIMDRLNDINMKLLEVRFKKKWRDNLLRVSTCMLWRIYLPDKLIKAMLSWAMEKASFENLMKVGHFDAVLSTGSSVAAPNVLLGKLTGAKTIVCTRPSPVGIKPFDLVILPEHSRPGHIPGNVTMTLGVPNRITPEYVRTAGIKLAQDLNLDKKQVIGLLLGGDDPYYSIPPDMASMLCDILTDMCREAHIQIALTTSRRTNPDSEIVIKSKMSGNPSCCLLVLASEPQKENPVPGILGISDVTIVTEDSFSMVCETASSGRKIVMLETERRKNGNPKRQRVYEMLIKLGYIRKADISNVKNVILNLLDDKNVPRVLDDAKTASDAIGKEFRVESRKLKV